MVDLLFALIKLTRMRAKSVKKCENLKKFSAGTLNEPKPGTLNDALAYPSISHGRLEWSSRINTLFRTSQNESREH